MASRYDSYKTSRASTDYDSDGERSYRSSSAGIAERLTGQSLRFDYLAKAALQDLIQERGDLAARNHSDIAGMLTDISGDISGCDNLPYSEEARQRKMKLLKIKCDLERQERQEGVSRWKDTELIRQKLIDAMRKHEGSLLRSEMLKPATYHNEYEITEDTVDSNDVSST